ncbi:hypothetical protein FOCG_18245 [Fusarium oxysporum f. sp. radicis-lycopersici 26381]|nr:hypothetical protein FOCG_18245 [Fusarium oxysporum f. sp. radicis-lycopersici 26381]
MAGTGKSTISRTVARSRPKQGDHRASFFFKRGETDRGNLAKFVPTVARQLAWSTPGVATFIKNAVEADPAIANKAIREQFEKLVQEPLSTVAVASLSRQSVVLIVDALDECEKELNVSILLELFSTLGFAGSLCIRVIITSRPELLVRLGFLSIGHTLDQQNRSGVPVARPNVLRDGRQFKLIPTEQTQNKEKIGDKEA